MTPERYKQKLTVFMNIAKEIATLPECERKGVGTIIVTPTFSQIVSIGYNGNYSGAPHSCDTKTVGACGCLHSEVNALIKLRTHYTNLLLFNTLSPCIMCAKLIVNSAVISTVIYDEEYRDLAGVNLLNSVGIKCVSLQSLISSNKPEEDLLLCKKKNKFLLPILVNIIKRLKRK